MQLSEFKKKIFCKYKAVAKNIPSVTAEQKFPLTQEKKLFFIVKWTLSSFAD